MQRVLFASSQAREGSNPAASEGRRTNEDGFLENEDAEEEDRAPAAAAELEAPLGDDGNQQWQYLLADRRIQDLMDNSNQDRQVNTINQSKTLLRLA